MSLYQAPRNTICGHIRQNTLGSVGNNLVNTITKPLLGPGPSQAVTKAEAIQKNIVGRRVENKGRSPYWITKCQRNLWVHHLERSGAVPWNHNWIPRRRLGSVSIVNINNSPRDYLDLVSPKRPHLLLYWQDYSAKLDPRVEEWCKLLLLEGHKQANLLSSWISQARSKEERVVWERVTEALLQTLNPLHHFLDASMSIRREVDRREELILHKRDGTIVMYTCPGTNSTLSR